MDVRNTDDTGGQEGHSVTGETEGLEDGGGVVQNGVDTSPLLEEHGHGSDGGTVDEGCTNGIQRLTRREQMDRDAHCAKSRDSCTRTDQA